MVLTERERNIAIAVGVLLALLLLVYWPIYPYIQRRMEITADVEKANADIEQAAFTAKRQAQMRKVFAQMKDGLNKESDEAQSELRNNLDEWAVDCGVNVVTLDLVRETPPVKNTPEAKFQQISFHFTGSGPLSTLARLLWRIETASTPIRVSDIQIGPRNGREGKDDLMFQLSVSTLVRLPDADRNGRSFGSSADARGGGL